MIRWPRRTESRSKIAERIGPRALARSALTGCDGLPKTGEAWVRSGLLGRDRLRFLPIPGKPSRCSSTPCKTGKRRRARPHRARLHSLPARSKTARSPFAGFLPVLSPLAGQRTLYPKLQVHAPLRTSLGRPPFFSRLNPLLEKRFFFRKLCLRPSEVINVAERWVHAYWPRFPRNAHEGNIPRAPLRAEEFWPPRRPSAVQREGGRPNERSS